jgi:hypothetical protein
MQNEINSNEEGFDPFSKDSNDLSFVSSSVIEVMDSQSIVKPLDSNFLPLDSAPYKKYNYLHDAWHTPSHGININDTDELNSFFKDIEKSQNMWEDSGIHLGLIFQAVEKDTVIDMGCPIGLVPQINANKDEYYNDLQTHIAAPQIKDFIEMYKKYLTEQVIENLDNVSVEIKPFYDINEQKINYNLVEQNVNKKLKIK